ncbi:DDE-type integrase/transposase/recombinase [Dactylosporangium sp. NPDC049525]|uniref:DDE-type integrase/transposase/recombinase n=1 Tax=Dactylosporangium sp. NPDC049525 TaxID=3154730 RepID=UPI003431EE01
MKRHHRVVTDDDESGNTRGADQDPLRRSRCLLTGTDVFLGRNKVIDVLVSAHRNAAAARRFFRRALATLKVTPSEVVTDAAAVYPAVLDELVPSAWHHVERYANHRIETDHSQLKHRLRPMRGLRTDRTATVIIAGHAFMQNVRRGHYELGLDAARGLRIAAVFTELAAAI